MNLRSRNPWELNGFALPHQAIPLGNGLWRGPTPVSRQEAELQKLGLQVHQQLADGSTAFSLERNAFADPSDPLSAEEFQNLEIGSASWIAARIQLGKAALESPSGPCTWMAILNLTPDSFSDGGDLLQANPSVLIKAAELAAKEGASWLDLGAESTRPGAAAVPPQIQLERLLPAIDALLSIGVPISIDTRSPEVASACLKAGATMINDVSGFADPELAQLCAKAKCPAVLMHMRGTPATMQNHCDYKHLLGEIADELAQSADRGLKAGLPSECITLDPGIGFAKTAEQNLELLADVGALRALGFPLLVGPSRKSFLASIIPGKEAAERDCGSAGAAASCAIQGVAILRLHRGTYWDAVKVAASISAAQSKF